MAQPGPRLHGSRRFALGLALGLALLLAAPFSAVAGGRGSTIAGVGPGDASGFPGSAQYRQAEEHAGDVIDFEPGGLVTIPFVPPGDDDWPVDGAVPRPLPAGLATGRQMRDAPQARTWATGTPEDAAEPWHFEGLRGASEATSDPPRDSSGDATLARATLPRSIDELDGARVSSNGLRREVFGFLPYWELGDRSTVLDWRTLSTVAYFSVGCTSTGRLLKRYPNGSPSTGWAGWTSSRMSSIINAAHEHQTRVVLTVTCFSWTAAGAATQTALLRSATARATLARQVAAAVRDRGADGVNLDFEPIAAGYGDEFTKLVRSIRAELRAIAPGYQLTFDAMGTLGNQPIAAATAPGGADAVLVMGYDYRTPTASVAGSISPLAGPEYDLNDTIRAFSAVVPRSKLILGVPWYGRAWSTPSAQPHARNISGAKYGAVAEPTYTQAFDLLRAFGRRWDSVEASPWTAYHKETCTATYGCVTSWRELYVDDAASLRLRYDLVNRASLRGVGIWALGFDGSHPELRAGLAAKFLSDRTPPVAGIVTLPQRERDEGFRVAWTTYDESAIRGYDVQVSVDGGKWAGWLSGTTASSAIYLGSNGHTYAFRVRATDAHGNVAAWRVLPLGSLAAPRSIKVGGYATVVTDGLRLREAASLGASVMTRLRKGDALQVIGGPVSADGFTWYQVSGPVRQWGPVDSMQVGGWIAAAGRGVTNAAPRGAVYATHIDAGITGLRLNDGRARVLTPNGDGIADKLRLAWTNHRAFDGLTLRIYRSDGRLIGAVALGASRRTVGRHIFDWDGRVGGSRVASGTYVVQLQGSAGSTTDSAPSASPVSAAQLARWGVVIGRTAPTAVVSIRTAPVSPTRAKAITYTVTFGGPVRSLARSDLLRSGTATGCTIGTPTSAGSAATWSFTVTGCSAGRLVVSIRAGAVVDAVSNWGPAGKVSAPTVIIDRTPPSASALRVKLRNGVSLGSPSSAAELAASLTWSAADVGGAGIASYDVRRSVDGGAFSDLATGVTAANVGVSLTPGHSYRFEVRPRDRAGNLGDWIAGDTVRAALPQQSAPALVYSGAWGLGADTHDSAGYTRFAAAAGASVRYTFTGSSVAFVTTRAPDRGMVKVYLDGTFVATVDTYARSPGFRYVAWSRTWASAGTHTLKLVVTGTAGHPRVDLDAFEMLR